MRIRSSKGQKDDPTSVDKLMGYTKDSYNSFMDYVAFRDDDPIWMMAYKLGFRLVGAIVFVALSPFLLLSLIIAVMAAI